MKKYYILFISTPVSLKLVGYHHFNIVILWFLPYWKNTLSDAESRQLITFVRCVQRMTRRYLHQWNQKRYEAVSICWRCGETFGADPCVLGVEQPMAIRISSTATHPLASLLDFISPPRQLRITSEIALTDVFCWSSSLSLHRISFAIRNLNHCTLSILGRLDLIDILNTHPFNPKADLDAQTLAILSSGTGFSLFWTGLC